MNKTMFILKQMEHTGAYMEKLFMYGQYYCREGASLL